MRRSNASAAHIERRGNDAIDAQRLERVHRPNDVDNRVERADFVKVNTLDGRTVNGGLCLRQSVEQSLRSLLPSRGERRTVNQTRNLREGPMWTVRVSLDLVRLGGEVPDAACA